MVCVMSGHATDVLVDVVGGSEGVTDDTSGVGSEILREDGDKSDERHTVNVPYQHYMHTWIHLYL